MISGAAGALAVVVTDLTADNGVLDYLTPAQRLNVLYMTMLVCGMTQILFAWFRLANLVKLIPQTGLIGFSTCPNRSAGNQRNSSKGCGIRVSYLSYFDCWFVFQSQWMDLLSVSFVPCHTFYF